MCQKLLLPNSSILRVDTVQHGRVVCPAPSHDEMLQSWRCLRYSEYPWGYLIIPSSSHLLKTALETSTQSSEERDGSQCDARWEKPGWSLTGPVPQRPHPGSHGVATSSIEGEPREQGGAEAMSTFTHCACLPGWLQVECGFWHGGLHWLASPSEMRSPFLTEVEVEGGKPGLAEGCDEELASWATTPCVSFLWFCWRTVSPSKKLWHFPSESCQSRVESTPREPGNGGIWTSHLLQEEALGCPGSPKGLLCDSHKRHSPESTHTWKGHWERYA